MNIDNISIIGHSLGGQVAGYVASEEKNLVSNLIMIDTFIRPQTGIHLKMKVGL